MPIYDFKESRRVGYRSVDVPESRVVILEGIYALNARLRPLLDLRVSITGARDSFWRLSGGGEGGWVGGLVGCGMMCMCVCLWWWW